MSQSDSNVYKNKNANAVLLDHIRKLVNENKFLSIVIQNKINAKLMKMVAMGTILAKY